MDTLWIPSGYRCADSASGSRARPGASAGTSRENASTSRRVLAASFQREREREREREPVPFSGCLVRARVDGETPDSEKRLCPSETRVRKRLERARYTYPKRRRARSSRPTRICASTRRPMRRGKVSIDVELRFEFGEYTAWRVHGTGLWTWSRVTIRETHISIERVQWDLLGARPCVKGRDPTLASRLYESGHSTGRRAQARGTRHDARTRRRIPEGIPLDFERVVSTEPLEESTRVWETVYSGKERRVATGKRKETLRSPT